ncbi:golgin subfamily A member 4 [Gracilaria domingensis]|nr:golgin subfamily A member 4 [Gracilaria domingensis]
MPPPQSDTNRLAHTVDRLRADLAKHKRRLEKAARKETELETLLLSSEGDIEALRARLTAAQLERDQQRAQSEKFNAALKRQHHAQLNELRQSNALLRSNLDKRPSKQQFQALQTDLQHRVQQLEHLSKQADDATDIAKSHSVQLKQKDSLLSDARQQLAACELQLSQYEKQLASAVAQSNDETRHFEALFAEKDSLFDELKQNLSRAEAEQQALQDKLKHTSSELDARPSVQDHESIQNDLLKRTTDLRVVQQDCIDLRARAESAEEKHNREVALNKEKDVQVQSSSAALEKMCQDMSQISEEAESLRRKGQQQATQIEEQQEAIEKSKELLTKAESQANSMKLEFEKSSQAFRTERDGLLSKLEEARALVKQRPEPEQHQHLVSELDNKCAALERLQTELAKAEKRLDASKQTSEQQAALIREKESSAYSMEQQLSQSHDQMVSMKSQFESQLNLSHVEKAEISARLRMAEEQLSKRPKEEECIQLKSALEHNMAAMSRLQADNEKLHGDLNVLRANCERQQMDLAEKQSLLVEAKNGLIECEKRVTSQESQHSEELKRFDDTLSEKDALISALKLQLQDHQENLSYATAAFEKEREQMQLSVSEIKENASLEIKGFQESQEKLIAELGTLKAQIEDGVEQHEITKKKLEVVENTISVKDSALVSMRSTEEKLRKENKDLSIQRAKLTEKLRESDKLLDEASETSKRVVHIQANVHKKEVDELRLEISSAKSAMDASSTLLKRVVQRVKQVCVSYIGNEEIQLIDIDDSKSVSELQILANNLIVSIEEHLRNRIHLQSELLELESREDSLKQKVSSLEGENDDLENTVAAARRTEEEKNSTIQTLTKKANELEKLAVSYKLFSEESEKRLQSQEEAAEVTLTSLAEELRMKEGECEDLLAINNATETKLGEFSMRLKEKELLEEQMKEMQQDHIEKLKDASLHCERIGSEKTKLAEKLEQTLIAMSEASSSLKAMTQSQTELRSECDSLETERNGLLAERSFLENSNHELEKQIRERNDRIQILSSALSEEKASLQAQAMSSIEVNQELEALKMDLKNSTESRNSLEVELAESSSQLEALRQALNLCEENLKLREEDLNVQSLQRDTASKEILGLQSSLRLLTDDKRTLEEDARELQEKLEISRCERNQAASKVIELTESLDSVTGLSNSLRESVHQLETDLNELRAMSSTQKDAISSLERSLVFKQEEIENSSTKQAELLEKISNLELDIRNSALLFDEEKASLRDTLEQEKMEQRASLQEEFTKKFRKASEEAEATGNQLRSEVSSLEEKLRSQTAVLATDRDDLRRELAQRTAALCDAERKLKAAIEEHQLVAKRMGELENELEREREILSKRQAEIQDLMGSLHEKEVALQGSKQSCEAADKSIQTLESELSQAQASLIASQSRSTEEQTFRAEELQEAKVKISELEHALQDSEDASARHLSEVETLTSTRIASLQEETQNHQQEVSRLLDVETHLKSEITALSERIHGAEAKCVDLEKSLSQCENLATERLAEIQRLTTSIIPSLKEIANVNQYEVERLSAVLDSRNEEWNNATASAVADKEHTLRELEVTRRKLHNSEQIIVERDGVIEQLKIQQGQTMAQLEHMRTKLDEFVRQHNDVERLREDIEIHEQKTSEYEMQLQRKEAEVVNLEKHLRETREKCAHLVKEKEAITISIAESQDSQAELNDLQRVHEKLLVKVVKLQRRAHRAEMLLQHEKKKHAVIAQKLDIESKRQVSPSTKGLSPAMKRPRAHSLRPPLSPRDGNSRPPMMPKPHIARRSLDFGA